MKKFQQLSVRNKLALVLWGAALLAFILALTMLPLFESFTLKRRAEQTLEPYAQLVSVGVEAAVTFGDAERAKGILDTLRANPQIVTADIVLENGTRLASYVTHTAASVPDFQVKPDGVYLNPSTAELVRQLPGNAHLRLILSLDELKRVPQLTLRAFGLGLLFLLAITSILLVTLQRTIVRPVSTLAEAAERVRTQADYTQRVPATGNDEVARLGQSFNAMMQAVQERENDLRQLNRLHRTILSSAAYGIISTTPDGIITSFNLAAERLLGYQAEEVVGKQTPVLWHDPAEIARRAQQLSSELGVTIEPGFDVFVARACRSLPDEAEWTFIHKDGARVSVLLSVTALRDEHGQITGYVGLAYNVTEQKRDQAALQKLNDELEQRVKERMTDLQAKSSELQNSQMALMNLVEDLNEKAGALENTNNKLAMVNKELESFSYSVSHDLRAPLRAIDGFSRIVLEDYADKLDAVGKDSLARVRAASQRMGQLIDDLLQLSRLTRAEMRRAPVNLSALARAVADELQKPELTRRVEFVIESDLIAQADAGLMRVVLENLLGNAWKFTGKQAAAKIEFGRTIRDGVATYFVRDNGVGFDMTYADKLFGAFQRLHTTADFPGTGIGLANVQRVIRRHAGNVWAESQPNQGATFYFTLPA
jgi:PAS domain S-box-containing protein